MLFLRVGRFSALSLAAVVWAACTFGCSGGGTSGGADGGVLDASSTCPAPRRMCGATCANVVNDPENCGDCNQRCPASTFCQLGECMRSCSGGLAACGASCVDFASDLQHCGRCDHPCGEGQVCRGGSCLCATGTITCGESCVDPNTSAAHCGRCDHACGDGARCVGGACCANTETACNDSHDDDCDGMIDCADPDCVGSTRECMTTSCGMGTQQCLAGNMLSRCISPAVDVCGDGIDQNCDGVDARMPDMYEPNDSCDACPYISDESLPDVMLDATIDTPTDTDCYRVKFVDSTVLFAQDLDVELTNIPSGANYDVFIYRGRANCASNTPLVSGTRPGNTSESITYNEDRGADDTDDYYVRVVSAGGASCDAAYHLYFH